MHLWHCHQLHLWSGKNWMLLHLDSRREKQTASWLMEKTSKTTIPIILTKIGKYEEGVRPTVQSVPARLAELPLQAVKLRYLSYKQIPFPQFWARSRTDKRIWLRYPALSPSAALVTAKRTSYEMYTLQTDRKVCIASDTPKPRDVQVKIAGVEAEHDLRSEHKEAGSNRAPAL